MNNIKTNNIPQMSVGSIVTKLSSAYSGIINKNIPIKVFPSVMLWGAPGIGKSQAIRQIANEITLNTGKRTNVTDVRLLLFNPIDLRGIPTSNHDKTLAVWLKPQIFNMDESNDVVNILFLDEISSAPQSVQAAAYQITLDRVVGEHKLPDNCIVIAAGNRVTDKSVAYKMPKALANRLMHIEVISSFKAWMQWAIRSGIHQKVLGFLSFRNDYLNNENVSSEDLAFNTPRSWEMVSNILNAVSDNVDEVYPLISGLIGTGTAVEFRTWCKVYNQLPNIEDIFLGKNVSVPKSTDVLYALVYAMIGYARNHKNDLKQIGNSIAFSEKLPPDFSVILLKDYMSIEKGYREKLLRIPEFSRWMSTKGRLLNGLN